MKYANIRVLIGRSFDAVDRGQCDDVQEFETTKAAKRFARYALTDAYRQTAELSQPMNYARVKADTKNGTECVADYYRRGYAEPAPTPEAEAESASGAILRL